MSVAGIQVAKQFNFQIVQRSKIAVSAFGGENVVPSAVPIESSLTKSSSGRDQSLIASRLAYFVQSDEIARSQRSYAPTGGFQIIDQERFLDLEFVCQTAGLDNPGKIRGLDLPIRDRARDTKACLRGAHSRGIYKFRDDLIQTGITLAGEDGCGYQIKLPVTDIKEGQSCVGASDVARQDHLSKFLQCRPSRSSSSSESFGPQLPAG